MTNTQDSLQEGINFLDKCLYSGYLLKQKYLQNYENESKEAGFDVKGLQVRFENDINQWLNEVAQYIFGNFEKNLYFHFLEPKGDALTYPHPLGNLRHALEKHLYALEEVIVRLDERKGLNIRREIAEKEHQTDILYKISFSTHTREIKLNNMLLSRPNSDSKNLNFFEYVYAHQNELVNVKDIEKETAYGISGNIQDILRDLGFIGDRRKVFFPTATKDKVLFMNPISKQYAIKHDLPAIRLSK